MTASVSALWSSPKKWPASWVTMKGRSARVIAAALTSMSASTISPVIRLNVTEVRARIASSCGHGPSRNRTAFRFSPPARYSTRSQVVAGVAATPIAESPPRSRRWATWQMRPRRGRWPLRSRSPTSSSPPAPPRTERSSMPKRAVFRSSSNRWSHLAHNSPGDLAGRTSWSGNRQTPTPAPRPCQRSSPRRKRSRCLPNWCEPLTANHNSSLRYFLDLQ